MLDKKLKEAIELYDLAGIHPAADLFPMMDEKDYQLFIDDIDKNGFLNSVKITDDGLVIDGRNRLCASIDVNKDVEFETYNPVDPVAYVLSENLHRRHLTTGQRVAIGLEIEKIYAEEAKKRQIESGKQYGRGIETEKVVQNSEQPIDNENPMDKKSITKAGRAVNVSHESMSKGKKLNIEEPEIFSKVKTGEISLNKGIKEAEEKKKIAEEKKQTVSKFNETNDSIEWSKYTWNPITGCKMGCSYCYARDIGMRFNGTFEPEFHKDRLSAPKNTKIKSGYPNNVFVCSMADLFGEWIPDNWIKSVLRSIEENTQWNFILLTKNPKRYLDFEIPDNCWLGATADTQERANTAISVFNEMDDSHIHFLSCEPLLEEITLPDEMNIQWIIIGGQSRTSGEPEFQPEWKWVENIFNLCRRIDLPIYFKPNLTARPKEFPA